jgi:hypothetical protein
MISKLKIISKNCTEYNFRFESKNFVSAKIVKLLFTFIGAVKMQKWNSNLRYFLKRKLHSVDVSKN